MSHILLCTGIYPPEIGGPATVIAQTAQSLRQAGHQVTVVTYGDHHTIQENVVYIPRHGSILTRYLRFARAVRLHIERDTTVLATDVFSVGIPVRLALVGRSNFFLLRLGGEWRWERAVESGRSQMTLREFWKRPASGLRDMGEIGIYHWLINRARRVTVTSLLLKEILLTINQRWQNKIDVLPNKLSMISEAQRQASPPHTPFRLIYVGRFVRVKNLVFFANVLRALSLSGQSVACTFVGDGPMRQEVERVLDDIPHMQFVGTKNAEEITRLFVDADLLVLPSLSDICPNAVIEALAHGVPALCTNEHGLSDGYGGVEFISPHDQEGWTQAIRSRIDPAQYEALRSTMHLPAAGSGNLTEWIISFFQTR
ncbi:glycosyltransferase [Candidatus Uhrbacteria bacterium]|nr:glycosyltransferase [Candidatus Uhrbacteria bacterium]